MIHEAMAAEIAADDLRRVRALLRLPMTRRVHFLRTRIGRGSAL